VFVEGSEHALSAMSVYIDLNAVRAGIVKDPKDYRYCGYGEAVAGNRHPHARLREDAPARQAHLNQAEKA
jgi:hypothetical protein